MAEQVSDRYIQSRQLKVNKDGSIDTKQSDGTTTLSLADLKQEETDMILKSILKELKKMNLHLSILTDNNIKGTEVE